MPKTRAVKQSSRKQSSQRSNDWSDLRSAPLPSFIIEMTGKPHAYWMKRIDQLIRKYIPTEQRGDIHPTCDVERWIGELTKELATYAPKIPHDENMFRTAVLAQILTLWFLRVQRAKCYDPRRPVKLRQRAFARWRLFAVSLMALVADETEDPQFFPEQEWDFPFSPQAKNGTFI